MNYLQFTVYFYPLFIEENDLIYLNLNLNVMYVHKILMLLELT